MINREHPLKINPNNPYNDLSNKEKSKMLEEILRSPEKIRRNSRVGQIIKMKMKEQQDMVSSANHSNENFSSFERKQRESIERQEKRKGINKFINSEEYSKNSIFNFPSISIESN